MNNKYNLSKQQNGMALVLALIMLLLVTVLGVSAMRMSHLDTQVAGNSIYSALVFQGAESALGKTVSETDLNNLSASAADRNAEINVPDAYFNPAEIVTGGATLNAKATVSFDGILDSPVLNNVANSTNFKYQVFRITAESNLTSTSARDRHTDGRAIQIPSE